MNEPKRRFRIPPPGVLLAVALVLAVIAVGLSVWLPYQREQVAIREIERLGGTVFPKLGGPTWLRDLVGDEWMVGFDRVLGVSLDVTRVSDDSLMHLSELANLEWVSLRYTRINW